MTAPPTTSTKTSADISAAVVAAIPKEDPSCRVTVVGKRRRADLALPAQAPIAEYVAEVSRLCGQPVDELQPAAWSLALAGGRPLPLSGSLAAAGVVDGTVLYLRDVLAGQGDAPVVHELEEEVAEAAGRFGTWPWDPGNRAAVLVVLAAVWLVAFPVLVAVSAPAEASIGLLLVPPLVAGASAGLLAWIVRRRSWAVPAALRITVAFVAVPDFAVAGWRLGVHTASHSASAAGAPSPALTAAVGATLGATALLLAAPGLLGATLPGLALIAMASIALLTALHAGAGQSAAFVDVLAFVLLILSPAAARRLAAYSVEESHLAEPGPGTVAALVYRSQVTGVATGAMMAVVLGGATVVLAHSADPYAVGLAAATVVGLLARAAGYPLTAEAIPTLLAAGAGLLTLLIELPGRLGTGPWAAPVCGLGLGILVLLSAGTAVAGPPRPPRPGRDGRGGRLQVLEYLCLAAAVALAVGVFGVYGQLVAVGHSM